MPLAIELEPDTEAKLADGARARGVPPAEFAKQLLVDQLGAMSATADNGDELGGRSVADIIREVGTVDGLPPDLSTNSKYMEGFGGTRDPIVIGM